MDMVKRYQEVPIFILPTEPLITEMSLFACETL